MYKKEKKTVEKVTEEIINIGVNDREITLFEGQYEVKNGMAYNSYVILDEQVVVMDTVDPRATQEWLQNLEEAVGTRAVDYLVIQHMDRYGAGPRRQYYAANTALPSDENCWKCKDISDASTVF